MPEQQVDVRTLALPRTAAEVARFVAAWDPVIMSWVHRYWSSAGPLIDFEDVLQECRMALLRAVRQWDPAGTAALATYCTSAIINQCLKANYAACPRGYRQKGHVAPPLASLDAVMEAFEAANNGEPTVVATLAGPVYEELPAGGDAGALLLPFVRQVLAAQPRVAEAVVLRFGLDGGGVRPWAVVAAHLGCSPNGAQAKLGRVLRFLRRQAQREGMLGG